LLQSGKVKIVRAGTDRQRLIVRVVGPGEIFGELALMGETQRESSAEVLEEAAVWVVPRRPVLEWLRPRPEAWLTLAGVVARRLRQLEGAAESLLFEVEQRVIRMLLQLAEQYGEPGPDGVKLKIALSQRDLADWVGSTRETASTVLNRLRKKELIRIGRRCLWIRSVSDLAALAQQRLPPRRPPGAEQLPAAATAGSAAGKSS
jgi:CRP-like cAMP-binding protein